jgi:NAD(P)-dependent dehydrogenase (short-subunit alcohol dehydrogenase family)
MADEKRIIITGAGRGIGRAIALELASRGHRLMLTSRTSEEISAVAAEINDTAGGQARAIPSDVTDREAMEDLVAQAIEFMGGVDVVVNNAGSFNTLGPTWDVDPESYWRDLEINLRGPFLLCRAVIPHMIERGVGTIINMIGGGAAGPIPYGNAYGTSKAGLTRFTETLAHELKPHGISVFATNPGLVRTAMTELQLQTEAGKKWMIQIAQAFRDGVDRPPTDAALLIRRLVEGDFFALTGRRFGPDDDPNEVAKETEKILDEDLRTLRFR